MPADDVPVTPDDIARAAERVTPYIRRTPVMQHGDVTLKLELLQHAGSFKPRGAFNRVLSEPELPDAGLIAASGGNHGAALSYVGQQLDKSPAAVAGLLHRGLKGLRELMSADATNVSSVQ